LVLLGSRDSPVGVIRNKVMNRQLREKKLLLPQTRSSYPGLRIFAKSRVSRPSGRPTHPTWGNVDSLDENRGTYPILRARTCSEARRQRGPEHVIGATLSSVLTKNT